MPRANLFLKVFLWFWLIVVLVGSTLELSTWMIRRDEQKWLAEVNSLLPSEAAKSAEVFERSGAAALRDYIDGLERRHSLRGFLFDENGRALLGSAAPAAVLDVVANAAEAARMNAPALSARDGVAAWSVTALSGRHYTLALLFLRAPIHAVWLAIGRSPSLRLLALLISGGIISFVLARHITMPLRDLRQAAGRIADGELQARVSPQLKGRRDEIALLARDFDRMAQQIEILVTAQRNILGDVSHELRSPLSRLIVALSIVRRCPPEEAPEYYDRIKLEADRLDRLIGQLLALTRLESGAVAGPRETFSLTNLVEEIVADGDFEGRAANRRVKMISADPCSVHGFVEPLRSAIENVVRNALRYTRASSAVEVGLQKKPDSKELLLTVRDHGPGVPVESLNEIFLPFKRAASNSELSGDGAGLGLAITERVVRIHGGRIQACNAPGGGLAVDIVLPSAD